MELKEEIKQLSFKHAKDLRERLRKGRGIRIRIHPDPNQKSIEDILIKTYGPGWVSGGGMGNLGGVNSYTMFLFNSKDKRTQICYTKTFNSDFGIDEIIFNLISDASNILNYKLVFRSWVQIK